MLDILHREFVYIWYYFEVQLRQIVFYWALGIVIGSVISVFGKQKIHSLMTVIQDKHLGALKIVLGIKHFAMYFAFVMLYALVSGFIVNLIA